MEENQELIYKLSMMEQEMRYSQQQLQKIEQSIVDLNSLKIGLDEFVNSNGKEILAPIGSGIFAKAKLLPEKLVVNIGEGNLVKKDIPETKKLIQEQIEKLEAIRKDLNENLENIGKEFENILGQAQKREEKK